MVKSKIKERILLHLVQFVACDIFTIRGKYITRGDALSSFQIFTLRCKYLFGAAAPFKYLHFGVNICLEVQ